MPVILAQQYILNAAVNADNPRIGYQTYARDRAAADVTVSTETATGPKDAPLRPDNYEAWIPSALPGTWKVDLGQARNVNYVGVVGENMEDILIEYSLNDSTWNTFSNQTTPGDDTPLLFLDDEVSGRYWRLTAAATSSPAPETKIYSVYIGQVLALQRGIYGGHSPGVYSRDTVLNANMSRGGLFLGQQVRRQGVQTSVSLSNLTAAWYRANFDPFVQAARRFPYFFAWKPVSYPTEVMYGWTDQNIKPQNMGVRDLMAVQFNIRGVGLGD